MLFAQQAGKGFEVMTPSSNPVLSSFGKVVGSIEGLRNRLDSFGANEIDEALEKIKTLTLRLSELQSTLQQLSIIRRLVAHVDAVRGWANSDSAGSGKFESTPAPLQLNTVGHSGNIILFPRLTRTSAGSGENSAQEDTSAAPILPPLSPSMELDTSIVPFSGDTQAGERPGNSEQFTDSDALVDEAVDQDSSKPESREGLLHLANTVVADEKKANFPTHEQNHEPENSYILYEPAIASSEASTNTDQSPSGAPQTPYSPLDSSSASQNSAFEFDRRLLNDLIKDYGEFVIPSQSSSSAVGETSAKREPAEEPDLQTTAEFPPVENVTTQRPLPKVRKDGDLDRKLKKLIKDYGEYDLYSDKTRKKFSTKAVAALIILGIVLAAIYFFSPSREASLSSPARATQSESGARNITGAAADSPVTMKTDGSNSQSADPGKPRAAENKSTAIKNNKNQ